MSALRMRTPAAFAIVGALVGLLASVPLVVSLAAAQPGASSSPGNSGIAVLPSDAGTSEPTLGETAGASPTSEPSPSAVETFGPTLGPTVRPTVGPTKAPATTAPVAVKAHSDYQFFRDPAFGPLPSYDFLPLLNDTGPSKSKLKITSVGQLIVPASYLKAGETGTAQLGTMTISGDAKSLHWDPGYCVNPTNQYFYCWNAPPFAVRYSISDGTTSSSATLWITFTFPIPLTLNFTPWQVPLISNPPPEIDLLPINIPMTVTKASPSITFEGATTITFNVPCTTSATGSCPVEADVGGAGGETLTGTLEFNSNVDVVINDIQVITINGTTGKFVGVTLGYTYENCDPFKSTCGAYNTTLAQSQLAVAYRMLFP